MLPLGVMDVALQQTPQAPQTPPVRHIRMADPTRALLFGLISVAVIAGSMCFVRWGHWEKQVQITDASGENAIAQIWVYGLLPLFLFWFSLVGVNTVITISAEGISLRRWGLLKWRIAWSEYAGWRWERYSKGDLLGLFFVEVNGRERRLSREWYLPSQRSYRQVVQALYEWAPERGELPSRTISPDVWRDPLALVMAVLVVLVLIFMFYMMLSIGSSQVSH